MMLVAREAAAITPSCAPMAGEIASTPSSRECSRAREIASDSETMSSANFQFDSFSDTHTPFGDQLYGCRTVWTGYARTVFDGFEKFLVIGIIAVLVLGPQRLPMYAQKLAEFVKAVRRFADTAKDRMRDEMGPEFDEIEWQKLDPRQYDPRRIIRDALLDSGSATSVATVEAAQVTASKVRAKAPTVPLAVGEAAPYDSEAT